MGYLKCHVFQAVFKVEHYSWKFYSFDGNIFIVGFNNADQKKKKEKKRGKNRSKYPAFCSFKFIGVRKNDKTSTY